MKSMKDKQDGTLVELSLLGNQKAYEELVLRHEKAVKGTAYKVTGNEFTAEDASQDAFVSAWIKLDSLRERDKFGSWVCSIAKNCARNLVSHYKSAAADISLSLLENTEIASTAEYKTEESMDLHNALETLSEKIRETIELHYFDGYSVAEIAEMLAVPAGTVKWRLSEGRKQLRKEYGVMEQNENATFVQKVMYQVEQLKLWALKNDKTGFEAEYRMVLQNVESLDESVEKQHALADVLLRGYWWLPGERNDEMLARIKKAAEESHNEDVMQSVMANEMDKNDSINHMLNTQIPYLEQHGFVKALGYEWFWLGYYYCDDGKREEGIKAYEKVLTILDKKDVYYANALSAIKVEKALLSSDRITAYHTTGELLKIIDGKVYFWSQPGYSRGDSGEGSILWNCQCCDSMLPYWGMRVGEQIVSSDGKVTLTCQSDGLTVETPAGTFKDCICYTVEGDYYGLSYSETYFCKGVGIVKQVVRRYDTHIVWYLKDAQIVGGTGLIPFAEGNRWEYTKNGEDGVEESIENVFEIIYADGQTVNFSYYMLIETLGYENATWVGVIKAIRNTYWKDNVLQDMRPLMRKSEALAQTKRQKVHTAVANTVMERILSTDPTFNPDYTQSGHWNFFEYIQPTVKDGKVTLYDNRLYSFEWKDMGNQGPEGNKLLYNFVYDRIKDDMGAIWSDKWIVGYHVEKDGPTWHKGAKIVADVLEDETVTVASGTFEHCRHVRYVASGYENGYAYANCEKHYWYAPGVGIVKVRTVFAGGAHEAVYELTAYTGEGEGYFPICDGLVRRYEVLDISDGWHGGVEYTYDTDETGTVILQNSWGVRDRQ